MRSWTLALSTIILSGIAAAQTPLPGTFNNTPPQNTQQINTNNGGYIIGTPTISLGNGITPTVVTNQDTVNVSLPQNTSLNGPAVQVNTPGTSIETAVATNASNNSEQHVEGRASRNFDFVSAPNGTNSPVIGSMADSSVSLGELARKVRNGKQIAKRSITNADINALNGTPEDGSAQQTDANGNPIAAPQNDPTPAPGQAPAYSRPSSQGPFGTPGDGSKPNAQQGPGIAPRGNPTPKPPAEEQNKPQLPRTSSSLPLMGVLGALTTIGGIIVFKAR